MAALALGLVGAAVGKSFGLASLGFMVGSTAGTLLFGRRGGGLPDREGPRLNDLRVQSSAYGQMIPLIYGSARVAGNVIWATPIRETVIRSTATASGGGKGGRGGRAQTTINYHYSVSLAVSLCVGPITGVRRIWANGRVIYNAGTTATTAEVLASLRGADGIAIYPGSETQQPDPTMQSYLGAVNVPAYLGQAYVVFADFQLADYGNAIPNFTFEVVAGAAITQVVSELATPLPHVALNGAAQDVGGIDKLRMVMGTELFGSLRQNRVHELLGDSAPLTHTLPSPVAVNWEFPVTANSDRTFMLERRVAERAHLLVGVDGQSFATLADPGGVAWVFPVVAQRGASVFIAEGASALGGGGPIRAYEADRDRGAVPGIAGGVTSMDLTPAHLYSLGHTNPLTIRRIRRSDLVWDATITPNPPIPFVTTSILRAVHDNEFWIEQMGTIHRVTAAGVSEVVYSLVPSFAVGWPPYSTLTVKGDVALIVRQTSAAGNFRPRVYLMSRRIPADTASLSAVVGDLCLRAGLVHGDVAAGALTQAVSGYVIANQTSVRAALEALQRAYFFDAVESDHVIRFVPRGGAVATMLTEDDLAAREDSAEPVPPLTVTRREEAEIPAVVNVVYASAEANYLQGTQQARRMTAQSREVVTVELPLSLSNSAARNIAEVLLYDAWTDRTRYQFSVSRRHARLEPTDVVRLNVGGAMHQVRLTRKEEGSPGLIRFEGVAELPSAYTQSLIGGSQVADPDSMALPGPTRAEYLDIPILRDQDDDAGIYFAAAGFTAAWSGAVLYRSVDEGASYAPTLSVLLSAELGRADTALGAWAGGNVFDEAHTVTVTLEQGELASTTHINVLAGANAILIGDEVVLFRTAELLGERQYRLSGLLRGRRGTEWAQGTHVTGERVVLLNGDLRRVAAAAADINLQRHYKAVTIGDSLHETLATPVTHTGRGLRPFSPVLLGSGRDAAGNIVIRWVRRTRVGGEWVDSVDAGLGETTEAYDVEVWNSTFVVLRRTLAVTAATATYMAADIAADGGALPAYGLRVFQRSSVVGRGQMLQGVISG